MQEILDLRVLYDISSCVFCKYWLVASGVSLLWGFDGVRERKEERAAEEEMV